MVFGRFVTGDRQDDIFLLGDGSGRIQGFVLRFMGRKEGGLSDNWWILSAGKHELVGCFRGTR